jgi:hypothetical protein
MNRFNAWPVGVKIASAALVVNTVRYVLVFLRVDSLRFPPQVEGFLLAASAISTGVVLTGGGVYIAHSVAVSRGSGARYWLKFALLVLAWLALLLFAVVLLAPALVAGWRSSTFAEVIPAPLDWLWAIVAVTAVEVLAGASVLAESLKQPAPLLAVAPLPAQSEILPAQAPIETIPSEPKVIEIAPVSVACPYCGRSFASQNALNPHLAKCKARHAVAVAAPSANGHKEAA